MSEYQHYKEMFDGFATQHDFPAFDTEKYIKFYEVYPLFMFAPYIIKENRRIAVDKIYGNNWAFESPEQRGSYPSYSKLINLLAGYTGHNRTLYRNRRIPPVPLVKIMGKYYMEEGNHRLYLRKLLGRKTILANVVDYDYEAFLKYSQCHESCLEAYVVFNEKTYQVDENELSRYKELKSKLSNKN